MNFIVLLAGAALFVTVLVAMATTSNIYNLHVVFCDNQVTTN